MLTSVHFVILGIVFMLSILLGIVGRILYYSDVKFSLYLRRLKNMILLTIAFPFVAYKITIDNRDEYIDRINKDSKLTTGQKEKRIRRIETNGKVMRLVLVKFITQFKSILDYHVTILNKHKEKTGQEIKLRLSIKINIDTKYLSATKEDKELFKNEILGMFAH